MKKNYFLTIAIAAILVGCRSSKTYSDIMNEFRSENGAEYFSVPTALLKIGTAAIPKSDGGKLARSISAVRVLDLSDCSQSVRNRFLNRIADANDEGYEPFVQTNEKDEQTRVLMRVDDEYVREILIASADRADCQMVQIKGKIRLEDVQQIVDENIDKIK
ncbi:MAG: DUF4252 domain-containing protein [Bacteroidaceae bacterium]|nr:DUF4252 domain-containing protein [Bacteroidaceae bacterium]